MRKTLVLVEGDNSLIIRNSPGTLISSIAYDDIVSLQKVTINEQTTEALPTVTDYVIIQLGIGKEVKLKVGEVLSPDYNDVDEMYNEIHEWVFGEEPATPAP